MMKRRDILEAGILLRKHKILQPGDVDPFAIGVAAKWVEGHREGTIQTPFMEWLEGEADEEEAADLVGDEDAFKLSTDKAADPPSDPTSPSPTSTTPDEPTST